MVEQSEAEQHGLQADLAKMRALMTATGLPQVLIEGFLLTDADLDALCDAVLSNFALPRKTVTGECPSI